MVSVSAAVFSVNIALQAIWSPSSGAVPLPVSVFVIAGTVGAFCEPAADAVALITPKHTSPQTKPKTVFRKSIVFPPTSYEQQKTYSFEFLVTRASFYALCCFESNVLLVGMCVRKQGLWGVAEKKDIVRRAV